MKTKETKSIDWNTVHRKSTEIQSKKIQHKKDTHKILHDHKVFYNQHDSAHNTTQIILSPAKHDEHFLVPKASLTRNEFQKLEDVVQNQLKIETLPTKTQMDSYRKQKQTGESRLANIILQVHSKTIADEYLRNPRTSKSYDIPIPSRHASVPSFDPHKVASIITGSLNIKGYKTSIIQNTLNNCFTVRVFFI